MRTFSLVVLLGCLGSTVVADDAAKVLKKLQGKWEIERIEEGGNVISLDQVNDKQFTLKGNQLLPSKNPKDPGYLKLSPEKKPAWIDLTDKDKKVMKGIYRINKDRWEICLSDPGSPRPKKFKSTQDGKVHLLVLRRKEK